MTSTYWVTSDGPFLDILTFFNDDWRDGSMMFKKLTIFNWRITSYKWTLHYTSWDLYPHPKFKLYAFPWTSWFPVLDEDYYSNSYEISSCRYMIEKSEGWEVFLLNQYLTHDFCLSFSFEYCCKEICQPVLRLQRECHLFVKNLIYIRRCNLVCTNYNSLRLVFKCHLWFIIRINLKFIKMEGKTIFIGLRREDKSFWERRTPMPPHTCKEIMEKVSNIK